METEQIVSFPLKGFLTRRHKGDKVRSLGSLIASSLINLDTKSEISLENKLNRNESFEAVFPSIANSIKAALFGDSNQLKPLTQQSSIITILYEKFVQTVGGKIQIYWVENHSTLVEIIQDDIPTSIRPFVKKNNSAVNFIVDVSFFLNEETLKVIENNNFIVSLLFRLGFVRGFATVLNFSDKESFDLTLSLLNDSSSLRLLIVNFLESNANLLHLDHDQSLAHCLKMTENSYQKLPKNFYSNNVFELEQISLVEKDINVRKVIKNCLLDCERQVVLLIKQMDISLPYNRLQFQIASQNMDIKMRRELCFQLIRNFNRKTELSNIESVVSRLKGLAKYNLNQPKLVVGRESRAFGNQAYLFANSKLIEIDSQMLQQTKKLEFICSKENLKQLIKEQVVNKVTMNYEFSNILNQLENKFNDFLFELVPSLGRLISLVYNQSKLSSFTQYNGVFQNLRESLEIFARKSAAEVEKHRKYFIENESSTRSNGISNLTKQKTTKSDLSFFTLILNVLTDFSSKSGQIERSFQNVEEIIYSLYNSSNGSKRAAYCVLLQRPSFTGSDRFKLNELESKPEQEEALQKLVRTGGDHLYMSPSYEWIAEATDLVEAVPLFIYERTIVIEGKPTTVFEVDQEGLEQTIRLIAEYWAQNIDRTIESEHISLARSIITRLNTNLNVLSKRIQQIESTNREISDLISLESLVFNNSTSKKDLSIKIAKLAQLIGTIYNELSVEIEVIVEKAWSCQDFITRIEAFERILTEQNRINSNLIEQAEQIITTNETERLALRAYERQRPLPAFHLLTTEAPGLIEGFITVVLEEEMAMRNVIKSFGLEEQVKQLSFNINKRLALIADKVINEFGYEPIVSQHISNGSNKESSLLRVMNDHLPIEEQVSKLALLIQLFNFENESTTKNNISLAYSEINNEIITEAEKYWSDQIGLDLESLKKEALEQIYEINKREPDFNEALNKHSSIDQFLTNDPIYSKEVQVSIIWIIRSKSFDFVSNKYPNLHLNERSKSFIREHTALIQTTCRRHVIATNGLHDQLCHPRFAYSSGVTFDGDLATFSPNSSHPSSCTSSIPTGLRKRYHLVYGPSRVNLGKDERRSVENWSQFIGVSDPLAAKHAQQVYELINYSPVVRNIREAENLKVSENQWTALVRSCRNVQAFFVERLGVGDIEDLSYQFNQRGGINLGSLKEGEGYNSGPTAGYCIPKDLLFKLFVGTHQDSRKLLQIGVPRFLHKHLISLMVEVFSHKNEFETIGEWELWAAEQFLNKETLSKRFDSNISQEIKGYLQQFISLSGSQIVFHLTKLIQILGNTGVPSPLLNTGRDLHSVLWSNWSDHKITLGGEQVNRSTVFTMTREIPEAARRSRLLNPNAAIPEEDSLRIQMNGVYKGDDDEPPPPDVRYSWTMRAFQILSGHYQAVADSLDLEGQVIARLSWVGFKPESTDPRDIECTEYLLKKFIENDKQIDSELIQRLKKAFPCHKTVGDVTITAVHGVDSEDLLGFSAETLTLLGDEADKARQILETQGNMSIDQMRANAVLRRKFPEEWTPLNQLSLKEQENIKNLVGESFHPLVLRLRGPGTNFISDLQGQDVVVFSITHPELLKLDPAHLRDLMLVGRPNSALCALDFVAQGRHRCWFERDVMLWYAAARSLTINGKLSIDWSKRNHFGRQSVYKAFGTGTDQYSPSLGTDVRSEVVRQERRSIEIFNAANNVVKVFSLDSVNETLRTKMLNESIEHYKTVLINHLSNNILANEVLHFQQYSQRLLMSKRFKNRDKIIQESIQQLYTLSSSKLAEEFTVIHWLSIGGIFLLNGSTVEHQNEILTVLKKVKEIVSNETFDFSDMISKLIVSQLQPTRMTLGERKGEMFSVKASEDCQNRAVARRAQLAIQSELQLAISYRLKGFEQIKNSTDSLETIVTNVRQLMLNLSETPLNGTYSVEFINETFGSIAKQTIKSIEILIEKYSTKENSQLKENITNAKDSLFKNGSIDLKCLDSFCGTYEDHGFISKFLEFSQLNQQFNNSSLCDSTEEILNVCELLYYLLALDKTSQFLTATKSNDSLIWRKLSEFFAKTIDDHFYEYNPWILDSKRGSSFVHFYDDLGIIKKEFNHLLYETSWRKHRLLYKYLNNLIQNHSDLSLRVPNENDRTLLIGSISIGVNATEDKVLVTSIGNHGVGEEQTTKNKNYESLWRAYNQLREISFMRNDGIDFPVVFSSFDSTLSQGLNSTQKVNLAILSPIGRTHYSRAIMESTHLNDNIFITRTGFFSHNSKERTNEIITREKSFLFIEDAHFFLNSKQYHSSLIHHFGMSDQEASKQIELDEQLGKFTGKGIRVAATFKEPILIGCCIAHHHHPLEIGLTIAGYPSTDKSPFLFDLTYNKSLYPIMYSKNVISTNIQYVLLPPQIDWLQQETTNILNEQINKENKTLSQAETVVIQVIKERLRPFALEHAIIIAKGSAESGARNLNRFDIKDLSLSDEKNASVSDDLINEEILLEAAQFIYQVSKGQNVTIQKAIVSTPLSFMSQYGVKKFIERQIIEHSVCVNIEKYPKDFIYGTLRVILSSGVPDLNDLSNPLNWQASHLLSLSSLQTATNVGRQGTLEMLSPEMIHTKFRSKFIEQLETTGKKAMSLTSLFGPTYWNNEINLDGSGHSYQSLEENNKINKHKILPFKQRRPEIPETDACGVPYWWPRYLMLDIISEPVFVDQQQNVISGAHIIDIVTKQSIDDDNDDQSIYTVCDKNGKVCEAKIVDFIFWLLEPNVGIGLWPNYWKRELVRCQEHSKEIDYQQVGISDRIVLGNFLKAGKEFLKVKQQS